MSTNSGKLKDASGTITAGGATNQVALVAAATTAHAYVIKWA